MPYPSSSAASDVWSLRENYKAEAGNDWPSIPTNGRKYADSYIATTGGTITPVATTDNLTTAVSSATDGDVLLLAEGSHDLDGAIVQSGFISDPFQKKNVLICGDTDIPQNVLVNFDADGTAAVRDGSTFVSDSAVACSNYRQMAFLAWRTVQTHSLSYSSALVNNNNGGSSAPTIGRATNCYIDYNGGDISWIYDNLNVTSVDVEWTRCTFANYGSWVSKYSGANAGNTATNCLFDDTTQSEYTDGGSNVTSATVDTTNRTYDTGTYPTAGHLYIPNTTAIF